MLEQGKIDSNLAILLLITMLYSTSILSVPAVTISYAKQDAWISVLIAIFAGLLISWISVSLSLRFPDKTLFEYPQEILGKVLGKTVGFLYVWWFLHSASEVVREIGDFLKTELMPTTPLLVFNIIMIVVTGYAVYQGLEVLSRVNQLFFPMIGLLFVMFILSIKEMKLSRMLPVFDSSMLQIIKGAIIPTDWLGHIFTISVIVPYLTEPREAHRIAIISTLSTGLILLISLIVTLLVLGIHIGTVSLYPTFSAIRSISIANFFERQDYFVFVVWVLGGFTKIAVWYYATVLGSAQVLSIKDYRQLVVPTGIIIVALSILLHDNIVESIKFTKIWPFYDSIFQLFIPSIMLIITLIRGKGKKQLNEE